MSTSNRMLFTERQKKLQKQRSAWGLWITCAVIAATATHLTAFLIGHRMGHEDGVRAEMSRPKPKPIVLQPANLIQCNKSGLEEVIRICSARKRMEAVHGR